MHTAVILAAGEGRRMWPYGETQPKAALPIANVPLVRRTVDTLKQLGFTQFEVVVGHLEGTVRRALAGVEGVRFHQQKGPTGTAAALQVVAQTTQLDDALVLYGDVLISRHDLKRLLEIHRTRSSVVTTLVAPFGREDPRDWLGAYVKDDTVAEIFGHPRRTATHRLAGAFVLSGRAWQWVHATADIMTAVLVGQMPPLERELAQTLQDLIDDGETVGAVITEDPFVDLDKPWHLLQANQTYLAMASRDLKGDVIPESAKISPEADIQGRLILGEHAVIGPRVRIRGDLWLGDHAVVDNGAVIEGPCAVGAHGRVANYSFLWSHSVVGPRSQVTNGAELSGVIMERVHLVHYMEFSGVIGRCTDLGAATVCGTLRFDDADTVHRIGSHREVPVTGSNATYIGDFCRTGVNVIFMPGVKMGAYSVAGPGLIVREDIPSRTAVFVEQQVTKTTWGPERYGW